MLGSRRSLGRGAGDERPEGEVLAEVARSELVGYRG